MFKFLVAAEWNPPAKSERKCVLFSEWGVSVANLTLGNIELFKRTPDECFETLPELHTYCLGRKEQSQDLWLPPSSMGTRPVAANLLLFGAGEDARYEMNDWSFGQLCRLAGVNKETVNRLTSDTAARVFGECLPRNGSKPLQLYTERTALRSIHGTAYTRVYDADLVTMLREYAVDFQPPQKGMNGGTGLYSGEQDMFCFLIDPAGWTDIGGELFAPGFFLWNSEVGRRSLGIQTFWFQAICQNHIVWDAVEVCEFTRKHTANVHESLGEIRRIIETLVERRDERRDGFVKVISKAMHERLGDDADEAYKNLLENGIPRSLAVEALNIAKQQGRFTIFSLVDALTRVTQKARFAGDRVEADSKVSSLLTLAA